VSLRRNNTTSLNTPMEDPQSSEQTNPLLFDFYLQLLGVEHRKPSIAALSELTLAQLTRIPFENISKLLYLRRETLTGLPGLARHLSGIGQYHFGGTCYANNYYFHLLLQHLGYDVTLCGADMSKPDVHLVNIVSIEGRPYLVDGGYAAPFLQPMPLDANHDLVIELGNDRYILKPRDENRRSRLLLFRNDQERHGYLINPKARRIEEFENVIHQSFRPAATFMNAVLLVRFHENRSVVIHNLQLIESVDKSVRTVPINDRSELTAVIEECFGIPRSISAEAISSVGEFGDAWT
jgi:N-hydroxyarylamine O-acetyltransferase